jgi:serine/threonine protein phosphatase PrpC
MEKMSHVAAVSHVGKIRSNNQDSGYAGQHLFVVADGMGGHAGGDVASAITVNRIAEIDQKFDTPQDAEFALQSALVATNSLLAETVFEHPELAGMGTTVSAIIRVGDELATAHIGDSRIYLFRGGELTQITTDHTFVQRLVDSGRITEEEAMVHPRRSVLMRVLGDVDASPEIDIHIYSTQPEDRWLICSDGLSGFVSHDEILATMLRRGDAEATANRLIAQSLDHGAPDNVTVIVLDIGEEPLGKIDPVTVGSAASPVAFGEGGGARRSLRLPSLRLHPVRDSHFEPESEDYLDELIEEDERRARRRKITWLTGVILLIFLIGVGLFLAYQWTQTRYYIGVDEQNVAIYTGVQQTLGPISLSHVYENTNLSVNNLRFYDRQQVEQTISAESLDDAKRIVAQLEDPRGNN